MMPPRPFQAKFISTSATCSAGCSGCSAHQTASDSPAPISARASWSTDAERRLVEALGRGGAAQQLGDQGGHLAPDGRALRRERAGARRDLAEQDRPRVALAFDEREDREQAVPELLVGRRGRVDPVAQGCSSRARARSMQPR